MVARGIGKSAARPVARSLSQLGSGGGVAPSYDTDAQTYITAVEAADGESLETGVKDAINAFVVGCKSDGIWTAIKASCILAGARTLTGALVPLVGTAPTNNNFVSGDYSRTAGLTGDGSTKYLNTNRNNNADPQNSKHLCAYRSTASTISRADVGAEYLTSGSSSIGRTGASIVIYSCNASSRLEVSESPDFVGFYGVSRSSSSQVTTRREGSSTVRTSTSSAPLSTSLLVFKFSDLTSASNSTLAFYSIGESLDLALLDSRVTTLITDIGTALA